jgi:hypothetical protein
MELMAVQAVAWSIGGGFVDTVTVRPAEVDEKWTRRTRCAAEAVHSSPK